MNLYDIAHNLFTIKDTRDSVTFLFVMTYMIIYIETVVCLIPGVPLILIMFIFYNYYYEIKFVRPKINYASNLKLL